MTDNTCTKLVAAMKSDADIDPIEVTDELLYMIGATTARLERMIKDAEMNGNSFDLRTLRAKKSKVDAAYAAFMA